MISEGSAVVLVTAGRKQGVRDAAISVCRGEHYISAGTYLPRLARYSGVSKSSSEDEVASPKGTW